MMDKVSVSQQEREQYLEFVSVESVYGDSGWWQVRFCNDNGNALLHIHEVRATHIILSTLLL